MLCAESPSEEDGTDGEEDEVYRSGAAGGIEEASAIGPVEVRGFAPAAGGDEVEGDDEEEGGDEGKGNGEEWVHQGKGLAPGRVSSFGCSSNVICSWMAVCHLSWIDDDVAVDEC